MSLCKDCVRGVRHEGTPQGENTVVDGVAVYIAKPTVDYPKDKAVLFLPDIFGKELINAQLLADDFANNGFYTIIPDYLNGDAVAPDAMNSPDFDLMKWFPNHQAEQTRPSLNKVIAWLKGQGVKEFGAVGYCFGGRYVFDLAFDNIIKVAATAHPSLLKIPEDLENYFKVSKVPLLINSCTTDSQFPISAQEQADKVFGDGKFAPGYKRDYWDGCTHGFAVRGDMNDPKVKEGKEGAFKSTVEWFFKYL